MRRTNGTATACFVQHSLTLTIMSSERPSKEGSTRDKIAQSFRKLSCLWHLAVSLPMNMNSSPDNNITKTDPGYLFQSYMMHNLTKLSIIPRTDWSANTTQEYRSILQTRIETSMTPRLHMLFPSLSVGGKGEPLSPHEITA